SAGQSDAAARLARGYVQSRHLYKRRVHQDNQLSRLLAGRRRGQWGDRKSRTSADNTQTMWIVPIMLISWAVLIGLAVFLIIYNRKKEKERTQALQQVAAGLGWSFAPRAPLNHIPSLDHYAIFSQGRSKVSTNCMYGQAE